MTLAPDFRAVLKRFETPDEARAIPKGKFEIVRRAGVMLATAALALAAPATADDHPQLGSFLLAECGGHAPEAPDPLSGEFGVDLRGAELLHPMAHTECVVVFDILTSGETDNVRAECVGEGGPHARNTARIQARAVRHVAEQVYPPSALVCTHRRYVIDFVE